MAAVVVVVYLFIYLFSLCVCSRTRLGVGRTSPTCLSGGGTPAGPSRFLDYRNPNLTYTRFQFSGWVRFDGFGFNTPINPN